MPTLNQRVDRTSITATFLPLSKGKKRGRAVGFCGGDPVASVESTGNTAPPFHWIDGKPQLVTFQDVKKVVPLGTSASQLAGCWYTPKHDERALVWTRRADNTMSGVELHPQKWEKSMAVACGDGQQVGHGYEKFAKDPSRALLWTASRESMVVLTGPDPSHSTSGKGVRDGVQVGCVGAGSRFQRGCLWRGTSESYVDLHPHVAELIGSDVLGVADEQQVGVVWSEEMMQNAALWTGSPESYVSLAPNGFARSTAWRCARGFQVGWAGKEESGMSVRALLWSGSADDYLDLQQFLPEPWNVSQAIDLDIDGDTLRILGTAQQAVKSGGYEMNAGEQPVLWEMKLLIAEPPARRELPPVVSQPSSDTSDERRAEQAVAGFARAIIEDDYRAAHTLLAPWLQKQVTQKKLRAILTKELLADATPVDFVTSGNDSTLDSLREHYREYHKNDATRTLASVDEFGAWGPPSIYVPDGVTPANFRGWMSIDLTPELDDPSGLDYVLRLWFIVVELEEEMRIGHLEPGE
jgi:hypothetical protein